MLQLFVLKQNHENGEKSDITVKWHENALGLAFCLTEY